MILLEVRLLIWINGAFGAGKTSIARELCRRYPDAIEFDPEQIGFMLRRLIPAGDRPSDFQDIPLWRELIITTIAGFARQFERPLIVPMALVNPKYFDEVMSGLSDTGLNVYHFTLLASPSTLRIRLLKRWSSIPSKIWTLNQIERCVSSLSDPLFATHIQTDGRKVNEITEDIVHCLPEAVCHKVAK